MNGHWALPAVTAHRAMSLALEQARGGYLCSPAQTLPQGLPPANRLAWVEAVQGQGGVRG